jgi:lysophospholipase L1-like esterase/pimeloyl-ACP methyl ester carboxylesterase
MKTLLALFLAAVACALMTYPARADDAPAPFPGSKSLYHGFTRHDFTVDGCDALVVSPNVIAAGRPWVWRAEFFDHRPEADLALLGRGYHLAYIKVGNTFGAPSAMKHWEAFYSLLTEKHGLSKKPALEGLSRGGLYVYNWATAHPQAVGCIYGDAPVCDFKSWPGGKGKGKGSPEDWRKLQADYGFRSEAEALAYRKNPVDNLTPIAKAKIPVLHVCGDADDVVPMDENTGVLKTRYEKLGGKVELIVKRGVGHHPHALDDPSPIVDFILRHTSATVERLPKRLVGVRRILFLGDSITYSGQYIEFVDAALRALYPHHAFEIINLGLPSETASGLSETGHAGGAFPRPTVHDRLSRALEKVQPDLVVACYGMNDGIYYPLREERFAAYRNGMTRLAEAVKSSGARLILLTPPVFDPQPIRANTLPAGLTEYPKPYVGYDDVLAHYSDWLLSQRKRGWTVGDIHGPMSLHLTEQRATKPDFALAGDGVHPGPVGHIIMAEATLKALGVAVGSGNILAVDGKGGSEPTLIIRKRAGGVEVGVSTELLNLAQKRQRLLKDAWLTFVGHNRPGMNKGMPLPEAQAEANRLDIQMGEIVVSREKPLRK